MEQPRGRVLVIAGSDSGGGAGLQADIKTVTALGGYAATAVTAVTVQNTLGVQAVHPIAPEVVRAQAEAVLDDIGADALKIGMLGTPALVEVVARLVDRAPGVPAVVDPVMTAKGGASLLDAPALELMRSELLPRAALLTPNAPEAAALTGRDMETPDDLRRAGEALLRMGARAVLVKGGHLRGPLVIDMLLTAEGDEVRFEGERIETRHTHGTGCTLASAIAVGLAEGRALPDAVAAARLYVRGAMLHAPGLGAGHGPMDHGWRLRGAGLPPL
jgi:hydroxymethylpyrimidine/phosphomethylpyrimidine kinase